MKLKIILGSTRPGRVTERLAKWVLAEVQANSGVDAELVDLKDYNLPFMNEAASPRYNQNRQLDEATKQWITKIAEGEAYIFVTPEYNHSIPGVLKNALDYLTWEMLKKPATVVSHGTVGGARAAIQLKEILSESRAAIIPSAVAFPAKVADTITQDGVLDEKLAKQEYGPRTSLKNTLDELKWYSDALAAARSKD